jgi:hypothetical protein
MPRLAAAQASIGSEPFALLSQSYDTSEMALRQTARAIHSKREEDVQLAPLT